MKFCEKQRYGGNGISWQNAMKYHKMPQNAAKYYKTKNKDLFCNGTFILPDFVIFMQQIVKLDKNQLELLKNAEVSIFLSNSKNKSWWIMIPSFFL